MFMHFDAMDALKLMFLLHLHSLFCSSFGAFKSHHSHLETQESALTVYDLSSGTSAHVRVIVDSMGLGEGGKILSHIPRFEINQSISTFTDWHGADLLCNLDKINDRVNTLTS
jgi:hypothetical protein